MGRFSRKIARGAVHEVQQASRKVQLRVQRFATFMSARWADIQKRFPQHRFYVAGILAEDAPKVRAEGVRKLLAVARTHYAPNGWWEAVPLETVATTDDGGLAAFGIRTGPNQITPLKLHPSFIVELYSGGVQHVTVKEVEQRVVEGPHVT